MRKLAELEANALKFWPEKISGIERDASIIPKLIETQDKFISLLNIADATPFAWKNVLSTSRQLSANLFLKHLIVLSDIGGEKLMRFKKELPQIFHDSVMEFIWNDSNNTYTFQTLTDKKTWSNTYLTVDGKGLTTHGSLSPMMEDVINLILFGGASVAGSLLPDVAEKCIIGTLIGRKKELDSFVRQRYIWVSRITGGATANALGNIAQRYVVEYLQDKLPDWDFTKKQIPKISQNDRTLLSFDIVASSPKGSHCAIEASFQVTTNSTIERKAGQAQARQKLLHKYSHKIAYLIDGAGNFERASALKTICRFSDCTVTFKDSELDKLADFLVSIDKK
jgi:hypothetical protein